MGMFTMGDMMPDQHMGQPAQDDPVDAPPLALVSAVVEVGGTSVLLTFNQAIVGGQGPQFVRDSVEILSFGHGIPNETQRRYYLRQPVFVGDVVYLVVGDTDVTDFNANYFQAIEYPGQVLTNSSEVTGAAVYGDTTWKFWLRSEKRIVRTATVNVVVYGAGNSGGYRAYDNYAYPKWLAFREYESGDDLVYYPAVRNLDGTAFVRIGPGGVLSLVGGKRYEVWVKTIVGDEEIEIPLEDTLRVV